MPVRIRPNDWGKAMNNSPSGKKANKTEKEKPSIWNSQTETVPSNNRDVP